jgi:ferredoxin
VPVHIVVDTDICIGSGECTSLDPEAIALDQGLATVLIDPIEEERAERICDACPVGALTIAG